MNGAFERVKFRPGEIEIGFSIIAIIGSISISLNEDNILNNLHKMLQCVAATAWHLATQ